MERQMSWYTDEIFEDSSLSNYIISNFSDPWKNTPFEGYVKLDPKKKGEFGERFVDAIMRSHGHVVERAKTSTAGHDRVINGIRVEIKFSLASRNKEGGVNFDTFIINHISKKKDWERLIFAGINEHLSEKNRFLFFDKKDFIKHLKSKNSLFNNQQGGKKIDNDDYMCTKVKELMQQPWVKTGIKQW